MNDLSAFRRSGKSSGGRLPENSPESGCRAPALVIRLEVGQAPSVVADWATDEDDDQITAWFDECPRIARIAYLACELAEEAAA